MLHFQLLPLVILAATTTTLHALTLPPNPSLLQPQPQNLANTSNPLNATSLANWPPTPFTHPYAQQTSTRPSLIFYHYGPLPPATASPGLSYRVTSALDNFIYSLLWKAPENYSSDQHFSMTTPLVTLEVIFARECSSIKFTLAVQALRDLMADERFGPREIEGVGFGEGEPWEPLGYFALRFGRV